MKVVTITTIVATDSDEQAKADAVENLTAFVPPDLVLSQEIDVQDYQGDLTEDVAVLDINILYCKSNPQSDRTQR